MLKHIFRITLRNIRRTGLHSFINVFGLSLGITCAILIVLFIKDEVTFDHFHANKDRLYRLFYEAETMDGSLRKTPMVPVAMGNEVLVNYPEVEAKSIWYQFDADVDKDGEPLNEILHLVDSSFLNMFSFQFIEGSSEYGLKEASDIVISEEIARKYFGSQPALGKNLEITIGDGPKIFEVSAVVKTPPSNSSFRFGILIGMANARDILPEDMLTSWHLVASESYVLLSEDADPVDLQSKFSAVVENAIGADLDGRKFEIGLQPLTAIHLDNDMPQGLASVSDPKYTWILTGICLLILIMASINFMNLSLGRSFGRAREIGVKKVIGAERRQLIAQFMGEALVMSFISLLIGLVAAYFTLPLFNELSGKELSFSLTPGNISLFIALAVIVGILAGIYPALVISGFRPVNILKGTITIGSSGKQVRKGMILVQLMLSVFLITTVLFMKNQLNYIQSKNLGFNREQLVSIPVTVQDARGFMDVIQKGYEKAERGRNYFSGLPSVENVAVSSQNFENGSWMQGSYMDAAQTQHAFFFNVVDASYIPTLEMEIVAGRNFRRDDQSDSRRSIIVNEAFVKEYALGEPVGARIPHDEFPDHEIIGVVKDFNFASLHSKVEPLILTVNPEIILQGISGLNINTSIVPKLMVRLKAGETASGLESLAGAWAQVYGDDIFNPRFVDDTIQAQYEREGNLNTIITITTVISVLIGGLGLFGLATLTMNARKKEMGIRKVLGAGISNMIIDLSRSYLFLVGIATVLSVPLTYLFINQWLRNFAFRIPMATFTYLAGGLILLIISVLILSYQAIKVARSNPIHALRTE